MLGYLGFFSERNNIDDLLGKFFNFSQNLQKSTMIYPSKSSNERCPIYKEGFSSPLTQK